MSDRERSHETGGPDRRDFLQEAAVLGGLLALAEGLTGSAGAAGPLEMTNLGPDKIPRKPLGKTGVQVSILGVGGAHLGRAPSLGEATRIVHEAIDAGINFMDNAWEYNDGRSEEWMGKALKGKRDNVFLMTKVCTHGRGKDVAISQLEESLKRLQTDHLDLWQVHEVVYYNDPELIYAKGGVIEALDKAKKAGKVKYVGFTGHKDPAIHLRMIKMGYPWDSVQMPLNPFDGTYRSFERQVLPECAKRKIAALGMKSLSGNAEPILHGIVTVEEALSYAMSLPVATTISGMDSLAVLHQNLKLARGFAPLSEKQMQAIRQRCAPYAADGHLELFKTTIKYDAAVGREQHGYPTIEQLPM
jgi:aryl-alcohol dehydrogenase-like predicted oxidoreductase